MRSLEIPSHFVLIQITNLKLNKVNNTKMLTQLYNNLADFCFFSKSSAAPHWADLLVVKLLICCFYSGLSEWDDADILVQVLAVSQQEYLDRLKQDSTNSSSSTGNNADVNCS